MREWGVLIELEVGCRRTSGDRSSGTRFTSADTPASRAPAATFAFEFLDVFVEAVVEHYCFGHGSLPSCRRGTVYTSSLFCSLPHTAPKRVKNPQREGGLSGLRVLLALAFGGMG